MAEFLNAIKNARKRLEEQSDRERQAEIAAALQERTLRDDNKRWIDEQLSPLIQDAKRDAANECVITDVSKGEDPFTCDLFASLPSQAEGPGLKLGSIHVCRDGVVSTFDNTGAKASTSGGIGSESTIINVKREILNWLNKWAAAQI